MADSHEIGTVLPLDNEARMVVTGLQTTTGETLVGPVARGGCMVVGELACKVTCQLWALRHGTASEETIELAEADMLDADAILEEDPQACPDENLENALNKLGIDPRRALIVAVGATAAANRVGYLDDADVQDAIIPHPRGWSEIPVTNAYNTMYARPGDTLPNGEPVELIGVRIAGSGVVVDTIPTTDGNAYGINHLTRTNMPGSGHEAVYDGKQQTYRQYVAAHALTHYRADPGSVTTHIVATDRPATLQARYANSALMDSVLPGWAEDGLIDNRSNPDWKPGTEVFNPTTGEYDILWPNYPEQVKRQVHNAARELGIKDVRDDTILDPGDTSGGVVHSSAGRARAHENDETEEYVGSITDRDMYAIIFKRQPKR